MNLSDINKRTLSYVDEYFNGFRRKDGLVMVASDVNTNLLPYFEAKHIGKVRDSYICRNFIVIITTDRQSAFDRQLTAIPYKGQVLNLTSKWWFDQTRLFVPNHVIACPHPNVTICKRCTIFPVEFVMRGYITGSTNTSIWMNYAKGVRSYCGHNLPEDMKKNQKLASNLLTPTTKDDAHDELISAEEIVKSGRMTQEEWDICLNYSHELFTFGQLKAAEKGLILVDTKYEFGKDSDGNIILVDEIQTPDSSRYWIADSYSSRFDNGEEPENIDKEFLRKWFVEHCNPYEDEILPEAPVSLINELSRRYILLYEVITGERFDFAETLSSLDDSIGKYFSSSEFITKKI